MNEIVFATNNKNKLIEIRDLLPEGVKLLSLNDIKCFDHLPEEKDTLEGNAFQKAEYVYQKYGYNCFADDTGLEIDSLNGAPGVYSARYAGLDCSADNNIDKVLKEMQNKDDRRAVFRTVISLIIDGNPFYFQGQCTGIITQNRRGSTGFGYDPIFQPKGYDMTFSQMSRDQKGKISHRGDAVRKLINFFSTM